MTGKKNVALCSLQHNHHNASHFPLITLGFLSIPSIYIDIYSYSYSCTRHSSSQHVRPNHQRRSSTRTRSNTKLHHMAATPTTNIQHNQHKLKHLQLLPPTPPHINTPRNIPNRPQIPLSNLPPRIPPRHNTWPINQPNNLPRPPLLPSLAHPILHSIPLALPLPRILHNSPLQHRNSKRLLLPPLLQRLGLQRRPRLRPPRMRPGTMALAHCSNTPLRQDPLTPLRQRRPRPRPRGPNRALAGHGSRGREFQPPRSIQA